MEAKTPTTLCVNIFFLLPGAFFSALMMLGGGGFVPSDIFIFLFMALLASLALVFSWKSTVFKPNRVPSTYRHMSSRKNLTHRNDPLLM
jgi:hypothetical protein